MGTLFKKVDYTLNKLIEDIEIGEIGLPDIQRPFIWPNTKVRDLFDSMYHGYPIGHILFWENGVTNEHRQIGTESKQKFPRLLIVDGQQRLTSLYAVLKNETILRKNFKKEKICIAFCPKSEKFEVSDAAIKRDPEWFDDISIIWAKNIMRHKVIEEFINRLLKSREVSESEEEKLHEIMDHLYELLNYPLTAVELSTTVNEEQVAEVFVRINSRGTPLNQADFILTLMSVFWDEGRAQLEKFCRESRQPSIKDASSFNNFIQPNPDQLLRAGIAFGFRRARLEYVYSILRGKDLQTEEFSDERRVQQFSVLEKSQNYMLNLQNWHEFFKALVLAGFRRGDFISSKNALLYTYAFYLIGMHDFNVDPFILRNIIARWFFMISLTGRYTSSPESRMDQDLANLRDIQTATEFVKKLDQIISTTLTDDFWSITLPIALATSSASSPELFSYYAALNLLDASVLFSNMKIQELMNPLIHAKKTDLERHHIFPKKYLEKQNIKSIRDINQIANYALVEWKDNIDIRDTAPSKYINDYTKRFNEKELNDMYYWHALPDNWENMDYLVFLEERRKLIAKVIHDAYIKLSTITQNQAS